MLGSGFESCLAVVGAFSLAAGAVWLWSKNPESPVVSGIIPMALIVVGLILFGVGVKKANQQQTWGVPIEFKELRREIKYVATPLPKNTLLIKTENGEARIVSGCPENIPVAPSCPFPFIIKNGEIYVFTK